MGKSQTNAPKILWWDGAGNVHVNKIFLSVCNVFFVLLEVFEWMNEMVGIFAWTDIACNILFWLLCYTNSFIVFLHRQDFWCSAHKVHSFQSKCTFTTPKFTKYCFGWHGNYFQWKLLFEMLEKMKGIVCKVLFWLSC